MKFKILLFLLFVSSLCTNGQEINLNSAVVATAGSNPELSTVNISKWRLGEVHLVVLQRDDLNERSQVNWSVSSYPNPCREVLNLEFKTDETAEFSIQITDITGKKQWMSEEKTVIPNQTISLDMVKLRPAMYLVTVTPKDKKTQMVFKIQKH